MTSDTTILFWFRFSYDDERYMKLVQILNDLFVESGFQNPFIFLPKYTYFLMPVVKVTETNRDKKYGTQQ